jgi:hypothetical protein
MTCCKCYTGSPGSDGGPDTDPRNCDCYATLKAGLDATREALDRCERMRDSAIKLAASHAQKEARLSEWQQRAISWMLAQGTTVTSPLLRAKLLGEVKP